MVFGNMSFNLNAKLSRRVGQMIIWFIELSKQASKQTNFEMICGDCAGCAQPSGASGVARPRVLLLLCSNECGECPGGLIGESPQKFEITFRSIKIFNFVFL